MIGRQRNRCAICGARLVAPHVDHDHETGAVRGILCPACNHGLGHFGDSVPTLRSAIKYLQRTRRLPGRKEVHRPLQAQIVA
jgi:hypothetical protein